MGLDLFCFFCRCISTKTQNNQTCSLTGVCSFKDKQVSFNLSTALFVLELVFSSYTYWYECMWLCL